MPMSRKQVAGSLSVGILVVVLAVLFGFMKPDEPMAILILGGSMAIGVLAALALSLPTRRKAVLGGQISAAQRVSALVGLAWFGLLVGILLAFFGGSSYLRADTNDGSVSTSLVLFGIGLGLVLAALVLGVAIVGARARAPDGRDSERQASP